MTSRRVARRFVRQLDGAAHRPTLGRAVALISLIPWAQVPGTSAGQRRLRPDWTYPDARDRRIDHRRPTPPPGSPPSVVDATLAFGLATLSLLSVFGGSADVGSRQPLSVALLLLESLPLLFRRRFPGPAVLAVTFGATGPPQPPWS